MMLRIQLSKSVSSEQDGIMQQLKMDEEDIGFNAESIIWEWFKEQICMDEGDLYLC